MIVVTETLLALGVIFTSTYGIYALLTRKSLLRTVGIFILCGVLSILLLLVS